MKNKPSKNHHCIPQFYLNNFATKQDNGSFKIFVYNKNNGKFFRNSVSNISFVKNYNTIKIETIETDEFEKLHNEIFEKRYSKKLKIIINEIECYFKNISIINCISNKKILDLEKQKFSKEYKIFLSILLAYFIKRSKRTRFFEEAAYDKMYDMIDNIYDSLQLDRSKFKENVYEQLGTREQLKLSNIISCFDEKEIEQLAKCFYYHSWNIGYNRSSHLLYTCDSVHALTTTLENYPNLYGIGYASPGSMIIFPLTPYICILMYDSHMCENESFIDCGYVYLEEETVKLINQGLVFDAIDEVYSIDGDWEYLIDLYKKEELSLGHKPYSIN